MQKSKKYPYLNAIDSQALFDECEKNGTKDSLSILTQFLHNSKYASKETKKAALDFITDSIFKDRAEESVLRDDPLELYFKEFFDVPFPEPEKPKFTFIDLFAGMGGFRLAMQSQGGKCIFSSEWNQYAQKTYMANFGGQDFFVYFQTYGVAGSRIVHRSDLPKSNQSIGEDSKRNYA